MTTDTAQALTEMLTENTGAHFLDSGSAYGRNWERNQGRRFEDEPCAVLDTHFGEINLTVNVFHFLKDRLEYDAERTKALHDFGQSEDYKEQSWFACIEAWVESLAHGDTDDWLFYNGTPLRPATVEEIDNEADLPDGHWIDKHPDKAPREIGGIYGEGNCFTVNTYNHDSLLSQVIQYTYWTERSHINDRDYETFIALQIHGGCDVRGGYTAPKVFRVPGEGTDILDDARADLSCNNCDAAWYTDDAYHWYSCDTCEQGLTDTIVRAKDGDTEGPRKGVTYISDDGLYCPCCGEGKLVPHAPHASC